MGTGQTGVSEMGVGETGPNLSTYILYRHFSFIHEEIPTEILQVTFWPGGGTLKIFLTPCSFHVFENTPLMSQKQGLPGAFLPPFHRKNKD